MKWNISSVLIFMSFSWLFWTCWFPIKIRISQWWWKCRYEFTYLGPHSGTTVHFNIPKGFFFFLFFFLGPHPWHMEVPRLGVESELQMPAYTTATATRDLSLVYDLHHSSLPCQIFLLSETRDQTHILMDTIQVCFCWATTGAPLLLLLFFFFCLFRGHSHGTWRFLG